MLAKTSLWKPRWQDATTWDWLIGRAPLGGALRLQSGSRAGESIALRTAGWRVELIYLALPSAEMSRLRVMERIAHGGHTIPLADIQRRFPRSLRHLLDDFSHRVDRCTCFMNDGENPVLVFEQCGETRDVVHSGYYQLMLDEAQR